MTRLEVMRELRRRFDELPKDQCAVFEAEASLNLQQYTRYVVLYNKNVHFCL